MVCVQQPMHKKKAVKTRVQTIVLGMCWIRLWVSADEYDLEICADTQMLLVKDSNQEHPNFSTKDRGLKMTL